MIKKCKTLREARKEFKKLTGYDYGDRGTPHEPAIRNYKGKVYDRKELKFYKINDLLISIVAVNSLNELVLNRFSKYVKHYKCNKGLIVNFNNTIVDFRYF